MIAKRVAQRLALPPAEEDPVPGAQYYYHLTSPENIASIKKSGLGQSEPVSLSPHLPSVHWWAFAMANPPLELLRTPRGNIQTTDYPTHETAELTTSKVISPSDLEIYRDGSWGPL